MDQLKRLASDGVQFLSANVGYNEKTKKLTIHLLFLSSLSRCSMKNTQSNKQIETPKPIQSIKNPGNFRLKENSVSNESALTKWMIKTIVLLTFK